MYARFRGGTQADAGDDMNDSVVATPGGQAILHDKSATEFWCAWSEFSPEDRSGHFRSCALTAVRV